MRQYTRYERVVYWLVRKLSRNVATDIEIGMAERWRRYLATPQVIEPLEMPEMTPVRPHWVSE